jgi:hypothetical protein
MATGDMDKDGYEDIAPAGEGEGRGRDLIVIGFRTTGAISVYHHESF